MVGTIIEELSRASWCAVGYEPTGRLSNNNDDDWLSIKDKTVDSTQVVRDHVRRSQLLPDVNKRNQPVCK